MPNNSGAIKVPIEPELKKEDIEKQIDSLMSVFSRKWKGFTKNLENSFRTVLKAYPKLISELSGLTKLKDVKEKAKSWLPLETNILTTKKGIGYNPSTKLFSSKEAIGSEIERLKRFNTKLWDEATINQAIDTLTKKQQAFINAENKINEILQKRNTEEEKQKQIISDSVEQIRKLKQEYLKLSQGPQTDETEKKMSGITEKIDELDKKARDAKKSLQDMADSKKLTGFGKFMNRLKSYLNVRLLRNFFSSIESGLSQSFSTLIKYNEKSNKTMSKITSQFEILSASVVSVVMPVITALEPILTDITKDIAKLAESLSYLIAKLTGSATYLKVNTDYLKELNKESNMFSFDKFEALNEQDANEDEESGLFKEINIEDVDASVKSLSDTLGVILTTLTAIGAIKFIGWLKDGSLSKAIDKLTSPSSGLGKVSLILSGISLFLTGIQLIIDEIRDAIETWDLKTPAEQVKSILKIVLYGLGSILAAAGALKVAFGQVATGGILIAGGAVAIGATYILDKIGVFANGGIADKGDLFIANESGPELVYSGANNSSSIMNIAQVKEAQLEALSTWWAYAKYDLPETANFTLDGEDIARSKSFIAEMNRKNAGLNLR